MDGIRSVSAKFSFIIVDVPQIIRLGGFDISEYYKSHHPQMYSLILNSADNTHNIPQCSP